MPKTARQYKLWADGKERHIQQEWQCNMVGLQKVLQVVQGKAQAALTDSEVTDIALTDSAVADSALNDSAVTGSALNDSAVTDSELNDSAVTDSALNDSAVTDSAAG